MNWEFEAEVFQWRGPAPYFFAETPPEVDDFLHEHLPELTRRPLRPVRSTQCSARSSEYLPNVDLADAASRHPCSAR
jgi:hypothetical protein